MDPDENKEENTTGQEDQSKLEAVGRTLNRKDNRYFFRRRSGVETTEATSHDDWHDSLEGNNMKLRKRHPFLYTIFLLAVVFFVGTVAFAIYKMQGGGNTVSDSNIDLTILGPLSIKGGEELALQLQIANNNDVPLQLADLVVQYPAGTRLPENPNKEVTRYTKSIGDMVAHGVRNETLKVMLFGQEKSEQEIHVTLEYRMPGSGAIYEKPATYRVTIDTAPVSLGVDAPEKATSGQEIHLIAHIGSNTGKAIPGLLVKMIYPPGFLFSRSTPGTVTGTNNLWRLGDLAASSTRDVEIFGTLQGQDNDTKAFQAIAGVSTDGTNNVSLVYNSMFQKVSIAKPFLGFSMNIADQDSEVVIADGGKPLRAAVIWSNNTDSQLVDCNIAIKLAGDFERTSVSTDNRGVYYSSSNSILWNAINSPELKVVNPSDQGTVSFTFTSSPLITGGVVKKNPSASLRAALNCSKVSAENDAGAKTVISAETNRVVKFNSTMQFSSVALHFSGPFENTGPFPPKADTDTSYTVTWSISNVSNNLTDAQVKSDLPPYATWLAKSAGDGDLLYNQQTGKIIWNAGNIPAGAGYDLPAKQISFQISVRPAVTSVGSMVAIIGQAQASATDDFTKTPLQSIKEGLTSDLRSDPGAPVGVDKRVAQ